MTEKLITSKMNQDPLWYKDAVIYQMHVRAFYDSDGNGIGDFRGLTQKLDYIENLGVTAIWLLPFYPSPLRDDGYDIADYTSIHPMYGSMADFNHFLKEAHRRGLRVITELVINHTSDQHPWFQRARHAPIGSNERDFYMWSDTAEKYKGARIIFKDFETSNWTLDPITGQYYWHRFYSHQPDLNYENPKVQKAIFKILDFWMKRGVDGLRLDAIPYLFAREGTSCENLPETHVFLKKLRKYIDTRYKNRMLLAEANQWPNDVVEYFGDNDECHMAFHFPIMPRIFMALRMENHYPIIDILNQTPPIPDNAQWALFLRNHDELTLEMVTDKERDYMYQVYARDRQTRINLGIRRRLAPLLGNDRRQIELMESLLFSLPGTPVIYYGDEIGMGDNVFLGDRNGVRTPMQWSADRNAGFSRANPQQLYLPIILDPAYNYESINVENQQNNRQSLLWWIRHIIGLRKKYKAFGRGSIEFIKTKNTKILAFIREYEQEKILIIANLSRMIQYAELDLSLYAGLIPVELFGSTQLPRITELPYFLTFAPYAFYWISLEDDCGNLVVGVKPQISEIYIKGSWENFLKGINQRAFENVLPDYLKRSSWFDSYDRHVDNVWIQDNFRIIYEKKPFFILILQVEYSDGYLETYMLPVAYLINDAYQSKTNLPIHAVICHTHSSDGINGVLYDACWCDSFYPAFLEAIGSKRRNTDRPSALISSRTKFLTLKTIQEAKKTAVNVKWQNSQQIHVTFEDTFILKVYRHLETGVGIDLEITQFLSENKQFPYVLPYCGDIQYSTETRDVMTLGILYKYVENQGNCWDYTINYLIRNYERAATRLPKFEQLVHMRKNVDTMLEQDPPPFVTEIFGLYFEQMQILAQHTAQLHIALGSSRKSNFVPEPFTDFYKQSQYQSMYSLMKNVFRKLKDKLNQLPEDAYSLAVRALASEKTVTEIFKSIKHTNFTAKRIRIHGDYSLGKLLYTGKDFIITNFEGERDRSLSERKNKMCPIRDIASMLRSIHYASFASTMNISESAFPLKLSEIFPIRQVWYVWTRAAFLKQYLTEIEGTPFMPSDKKEITIFLRALILERAIYELSFELSRRLDWVIVPLEEIVQLVYETS